MVTYASVCSQNSTDSTILGNFHQGDLNIFDVDSLGKQCTCNAILALCELPTSSTYTAGLLDFVLLQGDQMYKDIQPSLCLADRNQYLTFEQLPNRVPIQNPKYVISKHDLYHTNGRRIDHTGGLVVSLHESLLRSFYQSNTILLMIGCNALAMFKKDQNTYYVFDSHSRSSQGSIVSDGTSVLLKFISIDFLETYLRKISTQLCTKVNPIIEFLPVTIHNLNSEGTELFREYLCQQETISQARCSVLPKNDGIDMAKTRNPLSKTMYNRIYKQKQRVNTNFQQKETLEKRIIRSSKDYRQKEILQRQQFRSDQDYRQKEILQRQQARSDQDYRQKELLQKQQVRSDQDYRQKELLQKQQVRSDKNYRQKELLQKQQVRSDKDYRQKELLQKQQVRSDKDYRQKELLQKQQVRIDTEFRQKELLQKQQVRSDKDYRQKELLQKRRARSDKDYRQKEILQRQQARSDKDYRQKELLQKQQIRSDKDYRQKELLQKQQVRSDKDHRQKELLQKQQVRIDTEFRQKELLQKRRARSDQDYRQKEILQRQQS